MSDLLVGYNTFIDPVQTYQISHQLHFGKKNFFWLYVKISFRIFDGFIPNWSPMVSN